METRPVRRLLQCSDKKKWWLDLVVTGKVEQRDGLWVYFKDEAKKKKMTADSVYVEWKSKKKSRMPLKRLS